LKEKISVREKELVNIVDDERKKVK